jgi:hypothetical protein
MRSNVFELEKFDGDYTDDLGRRECEECETPVFELFERNDLKLVCWNCTEGDDE